jgi:ATP-dependent protease ClpP protease subunit
MKTIAINGVIGERVQAQDVVAQLGGGYEDVLITINSEGGYAYESFEIYNAIKQYKGMVTIRVAGIAASCAAYIAMAGKKLEIFKNSVLMIHKTSVFAYGTADDLQKTAGMLSSIDSIFAEEMEALTGKSKADILTRMKDEIWLVGAKAILAEGFNAVLLKSETEEMEITEQAAQEKVKAVLSNIKISKERMNYHKVAALITQVHATHVEPKPVEKTTMNLQEFLQQNPAGETEVLAYAKPKITGEALKAEQARVSEILALSGIKLSDEAQAAVENGKSPEAFAKDVLLKQQAQNTPNAESLGKPTAQTEVSNQLPPEKEQNGGAVTDEEKVRAMAKRM